MPKSFLGALLMAGCLFSSQAVHSSDLPGQWTLTVENPQHEAVATLKVTFTDEPAKSCVSGDWKVVEVVSATTRDSTFFPTSGPLSYQIENEKITIGRNELCDAYLELHGPLGGPTVKGDYVASGLFGGKPLGYFALSPAQ
jgi:hypothetical protein